MDKTIDITTFPQPPVGASFSLSKAETVCLPHPYCITPRHVAWAADHHGGMLDNSAIEDAEKNGAVCDICRNRVKDRQQSSILSFAEHEHFVSLFIRVPQNKDLNAIPGLHSYLLANKETFEKAGIGGFAFPV